MKIKNFSYDFFENDVMTGCNVAMEIQMFGTTYFVIGTGKAFWKIGDKFNLEVGRKIAKSKAKRQCYTL